MATPVPTATPVESLTGSIYQILEVLRQSQTWLGILVLAIEVVYVVLITMPDIIGVVAEAMELQALQEFHARMQPENISL
ncbi:MAG: hypothetical protein PHQ53_00120 [Candidatus Krumholzibacteria bacterium]|nr:hypothetical protein [Candidatus Krumholzibacteria bacterium]